MIAFVINSQVLYERICKGLARLKGEKASHFKVFGTIVELNLEEEHHHYRTIAYFGESDDGLIQALKEKYAHLFFISLDHQNESNLRWTIYQPFSQLLENLLVLSERHTVEWNAKKVRVCYRSMAHRRKLYETLYKRSNAHKTLVVDWIPTSKDDLFEGEEDGLLTYHLLNNKSFNMDDFKLVRNNNITLYRPMLFFQDYQYFDSLFPDKIDELCTKFGFALCLFIEHIGFGPCFDLEDPYGFEKQFIFESDGEEIQPSCVLTSRGKIQISDSWERIFECIDENR